MQSVCLNCSLGRRERFATPCADLLQLYFYLHFYPYFYLHWFATTVFLSAWEPNLLHPDLHPSPLALFWHCLCCLFNLHTCKWSRTEVVFCCSLYLIFSHSRLSLYQTVLQQLCFQPPHPMQSRCFLSHFVCICFNILLQGASFVTLPLMPGVTCTKVILPQF